MSDPAPQRETPSSEVSRLRLTNDERAERTPPSKLALFGAGAAVLSIVAALGWATTRNDSPNTLPAPAPVASPSPQAGTAPPVVVPALSGGLIVAGGRVEAGTRLALSVARPGVIGSVLVHQGERVTKGTELVRLQSDEAQAEVALRRAALDSLLARLNELKEGARAEEVQAAEGEVAAAEAASQDAHARAERDRTLAASGGVPRVQKQESEAQAAIAKARLEQARARLALVKRGARPTAIASAAADAARGRAELAKAEAQLTALSVVAPIDGVVVDLLLGPGEAVAEGAPVVVLSDLEHLVITADVPEAHIPRVKVGAKAVGTVEALGDRTFEARVQEIALEADRQKGTVEVTVRLLEKDARVRPRMSARIAITPDTP